MHKNISIEREKLKKDRDGVERAKRELMLRKKLISGDEGIEGAKKLIRKCSYLQPLTGIKQL